MSVDLSIDSVDYNKVCADYRIVKQHLQNELQKYGFYRNEFNERYEDLITALERNESKSWIKALQSRIRYVHMCMEGIQMNLAIMRQLYDKIVRNNTSLREQSLDHEIQADVTELVVDENLYELPPLPVEAEFMREIVVPPPSPNYSPGTINNVQDQLTQALSNLKHFEKVFTDELQKIRPMFDKRKELEQKIAQGGDPNASEELKKMGQQIGDQLKIIHEKNEDVTKAQDIVEFLRNKLPIQQVSPSPPKAPPRQTNFIPPPVLNVSARSSSPFSLFTAAAPTQKVQLPDRDQPGPSWLVPMLLGEQPAKTTLQHRMMANNTSDYSTDESFNRTFNVEPQQPANISLHDRMLANSRLNASTASKSQKPSKELSKTKLSQKLLEIENDLEKKLGLHNRILEILKKGNVKVANFYANELRQMKKELRRVESRRDKISLKLQKIEEKTSPVAEVSPVQADFGAHRKLVQQIIDSVTTQKYCEDRIRQMEEARESEEKIEEYRNLLKETYKIYIKTVAIEADKLKAIAENHFHFSVRDTQAAQKALKDLDDAKSNNETSIF